MKKLLGYLLLCTVICSALILGSFAVERTDYGYYDYNGDGEVGLADALSILRNILSGADTESTIIRAMHVTQGAVAGVKVAATVNSIDTNALTATVSTEYRENFTVPLSLFGLDKSANEENYNGVPATLTVHSPASKFFANYANDAKGIYLAQINQQYTGTPINAVATLYDMDALNTNVVDGSHLDDDYATAYLELNYREKVALSSATTTYTRYDNSWYPRIKKVNDNLYLLLWMYSQYGQHLYYATSTDGVTWGAPDVLWNSKSHPITYEGGTLDGTSDYLHAVNADACVLDDGSVLCVFAVRGPKGYKLSEYADYCGLYMVRGTVDESNGFKWDTDNITKIYTGQVWEPSVLQRSDGQIHVYFTQVAPDIVEYGYDESHRSTDTGLIFSNNNGDTWTPSIEEGDDGYYRALTIYREYVGNDGTRNHYNGQMPVCVELTTGKILVAVEIKQLNGYFRVSYALSEKNGEWTDLGGAKSDGTYKEGTYTKLTSIPNSSPYVDRFPSGEVFLTHNFGSKLVARLGAPDGSSFSDYFECAPECLGIWGACDVVDSHKVAVAMQNEVSTTETDDDGNETTAYTNEIRLYYYYLNHRINAKEISVVLDGYTNEWTNNTDALFVGSDTQAQSTVQVAHDKDNVYFLVSRLDKYLTTKDTTILYIADGDTNYYTVTFKADGKYTVTHTNGDTVTDVTVNGSSFVKRFGTLNINTNIDTGVYYEFAVPKSEIGAVGASSLKVLLALENKDTSTTVTTDTLMKTDMTSTENWIEVVLED
ncbi:MAG: hypothetical protein IJ002_01455 [Clostridia bacterium]|nr:hypothetical protein [Clostridia bacterium]